MDRTYSRDLNIMTTRTCNAACGHCSIDSSPRNLREMSVEVEAASREMISAFAERPDAVRVVFTGGEPFIDRARLFSLAAHARRAGLRTAVETNAYWATSLARAAAIVASAPVDEYALSASTFHADFVDVSRVLNAYAAAAAASAPVIIRVARWSPPSAADTDLWELLTEHVPASALRIADLVPAGRLSRLLPPWIRAQGELADDRCPADGIIVLESGRLDPCCSTLNVLPEHALEMGYVNTSPPGRMLRNIDRDQVFALIRDQGLRALLDRLRDRAPEAVRKMEPLPPDVCVACAAIMSAPGLMSHIREMRRQVRSS